jgi:hypothetical protein
MLSGWHVHAKGYAQNINSFPDAKVTAVWDEIPQRGKEWAAELMEAAYISHREGRQVALK